MASSSAAQGTKFVLGCGTLLALGAGTLVFGFERVGSFCTFAAPAVIVAQALQTGMLPWHFGKHSLIRSEDPRGFWIAVGIGAIIAAVGFWRFIGKVLA